jgi:hypothetical protein
VTITTVGYGDYYPAALALWIVQETSKRDLKHDRKMVDGMTEQLDGLSRQVAELKQMLADGQPADRPVTVRTDPGTMQASADSPWSDKHGRIV